MRTLHLSLFLMLAGVAVNGQWLNRKTQGVPRAANGAPDMAAPVPRSADGKPDLSGMWFVLPMIGGDFTRGLAPEDIAPWAKVLHHERLDRYMIDSPHTRCLPMGPLANLVAADPLKIIQTPDLIVILNADLTYRQIYMDGRELEADPEPSWMGYSVGHWDGETLVVQSNGFNQKTWLDPEGHPHSTALRMTERFRRINLAEIALDVTFSDPDIYKSPMHANTRLMTVLDAGMLEYVCDNERDSQHFTGRMSDEPSFAVPQDSLAKYAGLYLPLDASAEAAGFRIPVEVEEGGLRTLHPVFGPLTFRPIAPDTFAGGGFTLVFAEEDGRMTVTARIVEGDWKAVRVQP